MSFRWQGENFIKPGQSRDSEILSVICAGVVAIQQYSDCPGGWFCGHSLTDYSGAGLSSACMRLNSLQRRLRLSMANFSGSGWLRYSGGTQLPSNLELYFSPVHSASAAQS